MVMPCASLETLAFTVFILVSNFCFKRISYRHVQLFSCRSTIRDKVIPHAVSWFTGDDAIDEYGGIVDGDDDEDEDEDEDETKNRRR